MRLASCVLAGVVAVGYIAGSIVADNVVAVLIHWFVAPGATVLMVFTIGGSRRTIASVQHG
jgi:hypothetical protein